MRRVHNVPQSVQEYFRALLYAPIGHLSDPLGICSLRSDVMNERVVHLIRNGAHQASYRSQRVSCNGDSQPTLEQGPGAIKVILLCQIKHIRQRSTHQVCIDLTVNRHKRSIRTAYQPIAFTDHVKPRLLDEGDDRSDESVVSHAEVGCVDWHCRFEVSESKIDVDRDLSLLLEFLHTRTLRESRCAKRWSGQPWLTGDDTSSGLNTFSHLACWSSFRMSSMMSDSSDIATDLLKDSFDIDLIVWVMRELDIEDRVEFPGGYPGYRARVSGCILSVFDGKTVDPKPRLEVSGHYTDQSSGCSPFA